MIVVGFLGVQVATKEDPGKVQPATYALSFLWLEKNIAVAVDQIFNKVRVSDG